MSLPEPEHIRYPVLAIVGPTAAGKSALAIEVATAMNLEICCIDAMTIYRGMDIGTAKPSAEDRKRVPHHLLDVADPLQPFNVSQFQRMARATISGIVARGKIPLLVGGSGLYFRAVVDDLAFPPADDLVRTRLVAQDPENLRAKLATYDPAAAETIDLRNLKRVVRALEVIEITGSPFSSFREAWDRYESRYALCVAGIRVSDLPARIAKRTAAMFDQGLMDEVRGLIDRGFGASLASSKAIAYREVAMVLAGSIPLEQAQADIAASTRQYARRQLIWFRKDPRVTWFQDPDAGTIESHFRSALGKLEPSGSP